MRLLAVVLLISAGCKPAVNPAGPSPFDEDDPNAQAGAVASRPAEGDAPTPAAAPVEEVDRATLLAQLDRGPGPFLAGARIEAEFADDRFVGWRVLRFWPDDPRFAGVDIRPGDVVTGVNELPIARPEQWYDVFNALRSADSIRVHGIRHGQPFDLVFRITGAAAPVAPRS